MTFLRKSVTFFSERYHQYKLYVSFSHLESVKTSKIFLTINCTVVYVKLDSKLYDNSYLKLHFETIDIINYLLVCYWIDPQFMLALLQDLNCCVKTTVTKLKGNTYHLHVVNNFHARLRSMIALTSSPFITCSEIVLLWCVAHDLCNI